LTGSHAAGARPTSSGRIKNLGQKRCRHRRRPSPSGRFQHPAEALSRSPETELFPVAMRGEAA
jgi:hypothetical protein